MIKETASVLSIDLFYWLYRNWAKLVLVLGLASWLAVLSFPGDKVKIVYCNAGQGDETLIQRGFTQILIDGSRKGRALSCLQKHVPFFDRQIELVVVSHPQTDHFGGLIDVIKKYRVMSFAYNGVKGDSLDWEEFSGLVLEEGAEIETVAAGDEIRAGGMKLKVLWPRSEYSENSENQISSESQNVGKPEKTNQGLRFSDNRNLRPSEYSEFSESSSASVLGVAASGEINSGAVVMDFSYGDFNALFTGDIGEEEELSIIHHSSFITSFDILKVAHHGSKYSSSLEFLKAVRPALAVIEVGKNSYGHPAGETVGRLEEVGAKVLRTDQDGEVVVETDGERWDIKKDKKFLIFNF